MTDREKLIDRCLELDSKVSALKASLIAILGHIDSGYLVRDITNDHSKDWAIEQLPFLADLVQARKLLEP